MLLEVDNAPHIKPHCSPLTLHWNCVTYARPLLLTRATGSSSSRSRVPLHDILLAGPLLNWLLQDRLSRSAGQRLVRHTKYDGEDQLEC